VAQQGSPPRRSARQPASRGAGRSGGSGRPDRPERAPRPDRHRRPDQAQWQSDDFPADTDQDLPPWAGPAIYATRPGRRELRPPDSEPPLPGDGDDGDGGGRGRRRGRAAATRLRRSRRKVVRLGAVAVIVAVAVAAVLLIHRQHPPAPATGAVKTLLPGEFRSVPNTCTAVGAATLSQYVPGRARKITHSITTSAQNQCSFTVDVRPVFRVLEVTAQQYLPFGLASGNGSATNNAIDNFASVRQGLASPARKSHLPKAQISNVSGLGQAAFTAFQVFHLAGGTADRATVVVRDRNVVLIVTLQGLQSGRRPGGGFGPVSVSQLRAGSLAAARQAQTAVAAGPTVGR
jgi:hypothetical protein